MVKNERKRPILLDFFKVKYIININSFRGGESVNIFKNKLWNWGHLEGSHNELVGLDCNMTPEEFGREYGINNSFIVSYGGNIQPPYKDMAERFSSLDNVIWSVLGDSSTPLPNDRLGNTKDIIEALPYGKNIIGGVVDDFFSPKRLERFTPEVLMDIKKALNDKGLEFWCVLYAHETEKDLSVYMPCFDGVTFWIWKPEEINDMQMYLDKFFALAKDKKTMLGVYTYDFSVNAVMDEKLFEKQTRYYFDLLRKDETDGVIVCSSTIGDADLETNKVLKKLIEEYSEM